MGKRVPKRLTIISLIILMIFLVPHKLAEATNEGSYIYGKWEGSQTGPRNNSTQNNYPQFDNNTCGLSSSSMRRLV